MCNGSSLDDHCPIASPELSGESENFNIRSLRQQDGRTHGDDFQNTVTKCPGARQETFLCKTRYHICLQNYIYPQKSGDPLYDTQLPNTIYAFSFKLHIEYHRRVLELSEVSCLFVLSNMHEWTTTFLLDTIPTFCRK